MRYHHHRSEILWYAANCLIVHMLSVGGSYSNLLVISHPNLFVNLLYVFHCLCAVGGEHPKAVASHSGRSRVLYVAAPKTEAIEAKQVDYTLFVTHIFCLITLKCDCVKRLSCGTGYCDSQQCIRRNTQDRNVIHCPRFQRTTIRATQTGERRERCDIVIPSMGTGGTSTVEQVSNRDCVT